MKVALSQTELLRLTSLNSTICWQNLEVFDDSLCLVVLDWIFVIPVKSVTPEVLMYKDLLFSRQNVI